MRRTTKLRRHRSARQHMREFHDNDAAAKGATDLEGIGVRRTRAFAPTDASRVIAAPREITLKYECHHTVTVAH
jgi:hypothetical protein